MSSLGKPRLMSAVLELNNACFDVVLPTAGVSTSDRASRALRFAASMMAGECPWYVSAKQYVMTPGSPGDCLFVPPAVLLDIDERYKSVAGPWALRVAVFEHPDTQLPFVHCWLVCGDIAVSISGQNVGRPMIAVAERDYLGFNRCLQGPVRITRRRLRAKARKWNIGNALAKWISGHVDAEQSLGRGS